MSRKKKTVEGIPKKTTVKPSTQLKILGQTILIKTTDNPELFGEYKADEHTIYLNLSMGKPEVTLIHEVFHAILAITAHDQLQAHEEAEAMCRVAEHLVSIPGFAASLKRVIKKLEN